MKKTEKPQRNFVAYEYKEVSANSSQASFLLDGYENFGWERMTICRRAARVVIRGRRR